MTEARPVLLFDFFGTLVDYQSDRNELRYPRSFEYFQQFDVAASYEQFVSCWSAAFEPLERVAHQTGVEFQMGDVAQNVVRRLQLELDDRELEQLIAAYMADWSADIQPVTGAAGLLRSLGNHYRLGLISNTHHPPTVMRLVDTFGFGGLFETITLSAESGFAKPHPRMFEETLKKMGVEPADAVYIGDNFEADYRGSRAAGLDSYLIGRHARVPRDRQLRNVQDLLIVFNIP